MVLHEEVGKEVEKEVEEKVENLFSDKCKFSFFAIISSSFLFPLVSFPPGDMDHISTCNS